MHPSFRRIKHRPGRALGGAVGLLTAVTLGLPAPPVGAAPPPAPSVVPATTPPAPASAEPAIAPDRPGFTNGCETVVPSRTQIEGGTAVTRAGGSDTTDAPELLVRHGLTNRLELRVGLPDYLTGGAGGQGFGDGSLGVKYKFWQSRDGNTKAALIPALTLPVGAQGLTSGHVDPLLTLAGQTASGARWGIAANVALSAPSLARGRDVTAAPSVSASYQLTSAWATYGEVYDSFPKSGAPSPIVDGGVTFLANPNLQFDAEMGFGLGAGAPMRFIGAGIALRR